jgi:hypothetical protein
MTIQHGSLPELLPRFLDNASLEQQWKGETTMTVGSFTEWHDAKNVSDSNLTLAWRPLSRLSAHFVERFMSATYDLFDAE